MLIAAASWAALAAARGARAQPSLARIGVLCYGSEANTRALGLAVPPELARRVDRFVD